MPYYPTRWYYGLLQSVIKLVLTSLLLFIAPGTPAQIVAGMCISFAVLLWYLRLLPYAEKVARQIAYSAYLVIFLFFVLALLLKMNVPVTPHDDTFYSVFCGILVFMLFGFPVFALLRAGRLKRHGAALEQHDAGGAHAPAGDDDEAGKTMGAHRSVAEHLAEAMARTTRKFERTVFHAPIPLVGHAAAQYGTPRASLGYRFVRVSEEER